MKSLTHKNFSEMRRALAMLTVNCSVLFRYQINVTLGEDPNKFQTECTSGSDIESVTNY